MSSGLTPIAKAAGARRVAQFRVKEARLAASIVEVLVISAMPPAERAANRGGRSAESLRRIRDVKEAAVISQSVAQCRSVYGDSCHQSSPGHHASSQLPCLFVDRVAAVCVGGARVPPRQRISRGDLPCSPGIVPSVSREVTPEATAQRRGDSASKERPPIRATLR